MEVEGGRDEECGAEENNREVASGYQAEQSAEREGGMDAEIEIAGAGDKQNEGINSSE